MVLQGPPSRSALPLLTSRLILPRGKPPGPPARSALTLLAGQKQTHPPPAAPPDKNMVFETQGIEPLDAVINVRLTSAEKAALKEDADLAGLSLSELVRRRYFGRPIIANADAVMLKELRRLGGLLKHIHNESAGAYSESTASAIAELRVYIQQLSSGHDR